MAGDSHWSSVVTLVHFDGTNAQATFHDSSLSQHSIQESFGGQITTSFANFGTASADFVTNHGSGPCIRIQNSPSADYQFGSGTFTIECWVYPTGANSGTWIIQTGVAGSAVGAWGLSYNSTTPALIFTYSTNGSTNTTISGTTTLALNTWTHVAADYDGTTLRVYAGGSVLNTGTLSGALYATTQELAVGNDNHTDTSTWTGYIDEIRITKGVARYAGGFTPPTAAFPAYGTSPQPEASGAAGTGNATNASITYSLTTYEPNDIIVVSVFNENSGTGNPAVVASITASGLSFAKRSSVSQTNGAGLEVWWALATNPLIALSMTIAFTGTFDDASSVTYGVAGCATSAPWDANASLPKTASTFTVSGFSTTSADDCLVTFVGSESGPTNPFGFTTIGSASTSGGTFPTTLITGYQDVSSTQSSITLSASTGTFPAFIADALTADVTVVNDSVSITGVSATGTAAPLAQNTYANRVSFSTATTGTGTITLGSALSLYQLPALISGTQVGYSIVDGTNWEIGTGTYTASSPATVSRTTVQDSSTGPGVSMNLSGSATVSLVVTAAMFTSLAPLASPALTGIPTAPTAAGGTSTTQIATTAFVAADFNDVGRNKLHNPMFNILQRTTAPFTAAGYTLDRWLIGLNTDAVSVTQASLADADRAAIGDEEAQFSLQNVFTGTSGAGYNVLYQRIENVRRLSNKTVTASFWAKAGSGTPNIGVSFDQYMGTGGSPSSNVFGNGVAIMLSTTWTRYSTSYTFGSLSGLTLGTNNDHASQVNFWYSSGATEATRAGNIGVQSATIQLWGVQMEIGSITTPLEKLDPRYDLYNCQRFYQYHLAVLCAGYSGGNCYSDFTYPTTMRAIPAVTLDTVSYSNASGILFTAELSHIRFQITITSVPASGYAGFNLALSADL